MSVNPAIDVLVVTAGQNVGGDNITGLVGALKPFVEGVEGKGSARVRR
jgi:hypothetical protein